jgi:hypothetical protein
MTPRNLIQVHASDETQPHLHLPTRTGATLLWTLSFLFALRVLAQALQLWLPQSFLPPFDRFQGSNLPYPVLLSAQILILAAMLRYSWKAHRGALTAGRRLNKTLFWCGAVYMSGSAARIAIGLTISIAPPWFSAWISAVFHLVLAGFVLTLAWTHHCASVGREIDYVA